jgi:cell division FtsZ-interacting protein ZapD
MAEVPSGLSLTLSQDKKKLKAWLEKRKADQEESEANQEKQEAVADHYNRAPRACLLYCTTGLPMYVEPLKD